MFVPSCMLSVCIKTDRPNFSEIEKKKMCVRLINFFTRKIRIFKWKSEQVFKARIYIGDVFNLLGYGMRIF